MCPRLQAALDPSCHGMVSRVWAPPARHLRWIQDKAQDRQGARARRQECAPGRGRRRRRRIKRRERVREGARKSEQERSAALLCLRSGHQPPPPPALVLSHRHPSISSRGAQGHQQTSKQARRRPLATRQSTKAGQLYCESLIIAALLPIRLKRNARHSKPVVATQQRILRIALTRERNVDDVIGFGFKWFALVCTALVR